MSTISTIIIRRGPAGPAGPAGPSGASNFADIGGVPADNAALDAALDAKAPLASPTFTGTVTVGAEGSASSLQIVAHSGYAISAHTEEGACAVLHSYQGIGASLESGISTGARIYSLDGTYHATFGADGIDQSFVARLKGAFGWVRGSFTGRIHPPDTLGANRAWELPDESGTLALTSQIPAAPTTASIVTLLGLPTFATLAAANASGAIEIGKPFYNTALSKLDITTA